MARAARLESGIIALAFDTPLRAQQAALAVRRLADDGRATLDDAVMLRRRGDAPARITGRSDPLAPAAAVPASLVGGLLGTLVAGPLGLLVGGALAGGAGALASRRLTARIPRDVLAELCARTFPDDTVLVLRLVGFAALADELRRFPGARLLWAELPPAALAQVRGALFVA